MNTTPAPASKDLLSNLRYEQSISDIDRKPYSMIEHWASILENSIEGAMEHYRLSHEGLLDGESPTEWALRVRPQLMATNEARCDFENATQRIAYYASRQFSTPRTRAIVAEHCARMYTRYSMVSA